MIFTVVFSFSITFSAATPLEFEKICKFAAELNRVHKKSNLSLTMTMFVAKSFDADEYDYFKLSENFDFINVVQVLEVLEKPNESLTAEGTLKTDEVTNIEKNIVNIINLSILPEKMNIGIWLTGVGLERSSVRAKYVDDKRSHFYNDICLYYSGDDAENWERSHDASGLAVLKNKNKLEIIVYESTRTVANLVRFAIKHGLAGVWVDLIDQDDYEGKCILDTDTFEDFNLIDGIKLNIRAKNEFNFPILRTIKTAIEVTKSEIAHSGASQLVISAFCVMFVSCVFNNLSLNLFLLIE